MTAASKDPLHAWHAVIHPILRFFRARRGRLLLGQFPDLVHLNILDLGGSQHFWEALGVAVPFERITIMNVSDAETGGMQPGRERIRVALYDGVRIPADDGQYDLVVCNSVIEHVPPERRAALAREMRRVGLRLFVQTPAHEFPIEPHFLLPFLHWLPRRLAYRLVFVSPWRLLSRPRRAVIDSYFSGTKLLREAELRALFPDATVHGEYFLGLRKAHVPVVAPTPPETKAPCAR
jgi:hypothetical protein